MDSSVKSKPCYQGTTLITIYKAFVRAHPDYGDILFDKAFNLPFHWKLASIQYGACLAITCAIRGNSREKHKLNLESLQSQRWSRKLATLKSF